MRYVVGLISTAPLVLTLKRRCCRMAASPYPLAYEQLPGVFSSTLPPRRSSTGADCGRLTWRVMVAIPAQLGFQPRAGSFRHAAHTRTQAFPALHARPACKHRCNKGRCRSFSICLDGATPQNEAIPWIRCARR
ncbi:hypothetical protein KCP70_15705 [Salmonella enterica subsp. enterica]|nr:hypothetical protein KCP70_15705 [Salmonella enterica subsp. enterica]